jgi:glycosyltransferase involved in cell wall biosynthesis
MLLPSLWEGLPVAPMEAMSLGLPVVASKVRGNDEVVEDGVTGFLCEVEEPGDYARRLKELLADPALLARFGKAGADRVRCHFSIERQVASHVELYEELGLCAVPGAHAA